MNIENVKELCRLLGPGTFEVSDIGHDGSPCIEAKLTLDDGSFIQFRVSNTLFFAMSLFSNGSGLFDHCISVVPDWCRQNGILHIEANLSPESRSMFLSKLPKDLVDEFSPNPSQAQALRKSATNKPASSG